MEELGALQGIIFIWARRMDQTVGNLLMYKSSSTQWQQSPTW